MSGARNQMNRLLLVLFLISGCNDSTPLLIGPLPLKDWGACPYTNDTMTEFQKHSRVSQVKLEGKELRFNGIVSDVRYDEMAEAPVIFLNSPRKDETSIHTVFAFVPPNLAEKALRLHKKNEIYVSGVAISDCNAGALGAVFIDIVVKDIQYASDLEK